MIWFFQIFYLDTTYILCKKKKKKKKKKVDPSVIETGYPEKKNTNQVHVILFDALILRIVKIWWIKTA